MKKKKIVVQFIEAGQGHIVTAEAIAECLEKKYSDKHYLSKLRNEIQQKINKPEYLNELNEIYKAIRYLSTLKCPASFLRSSEVQSKLYGGG